MLVYRVETPAGVGPFSMKGLALDREDDIRYGEIIYSHLKPDSHPAPHPDLITPEYRFGCNSMEVLGSWFTDGMVEILNRYNFIVKVFSVKTAEHVSKGQVAFKIKNAVLIETHPLSILA